MELRQLEQFVAVAEEGHFARAAARCSIVPSALSTSVRVLERELGAPLLRRTTRSVALTEAGRAFLVEARKCLAAAAAARAVVGNMRYLLSGSLRVGGVPTVGLLDQPALLHRIHDQHPGLNIRYTRGTSAPLIEGVRSGELDIAVVALPDSPPADLTVLEFARGPILLACHHRHRLAGRRTVAVEELVAERFVSLPAGSHGRDHIDRIFAGTGTPPDVPYEVNDWFTLLDFVEEGLGVTLVIGSVAASRPVLRAIPIEDAAFTWVVGVVAPPAHQITPAAQVLLDMINDLSTSRSQPRDEGERPAPAGSRPVAAVGSA